DVRLERLGVDPAEERVAFVVNLGDPDPATVEEPWQQRRAGAVEGFDQDRYVRRLQGVEVDRPPKELLVTGERVEALDETGGLGIRQRPPLDRRATVLGDRRLDHAEDLGAGRRTGRCLDLEAVV